MILRGIDFGPVWGASGVQGFFGEGYPIHRALRLMFPGLFTFKGMTFVAKTITLLKNEGNMPLKADGITPVELAPRCIYADFRNCLMLNAVSLSNFGARFYFDQGLWQERTEPFFLSFMVLGSDRSDGMRQRRDFVRLFNQYKSGFRAPVALQENWSCPNVGHDLRHFLDQFEEGAEIMSELGIPYVPKFNALIDPRWVRDMASRARCDAICVSNTIPFGEIPDRIAWKRFFPNGSPLLKRGFKQPGGLSGGPLFDILRSWVHEYANSYPDAPLNAGGGLTRPGDIDQLMLNYPSVKSVSLGSVATLRPWRMRSMIGAAHRMRLIRNF